MRYMLGALILTAAVVLCAPAALASGDVVGVWKLVSFQQKTVDKGEVFYPQGKDAVGRVIYTKDGHMSIIVTAANRSQSDVITDEERVKAYATMFAYVATYKAEGSTITTKIAESWRPDWVGRVGVSNYKVEGNKLTTESAKPFKNIRGVDVTAHLVWERID